MYGLLVVEVLGISNVETEEIGQLSGRIDLSLPGILALTQHGSGHNIVAVLGGDEVGGLEEDGGTVSERKGLPGGLCGQGGIDSLGNVGVGRGVVRSHGGGVIRGVDLRRQSRAGNLGIVSKQTTFAYTSLTDGF